VVEVEVRTTKPETSRAACGQRTACPDEGVPERQVHSVAKRNPNIRGVPQVRSAPQHAQRAAGGSGRIDTRARLVGVHVRPVVHPLPHIAEGVEQPEGVGMLVCDPVGPIAVGGEALVVFPITAARSI
jgi:hypothetical protein